MERGKSGTWRNKHYAFFQNRECEYFPCHDTEDTENFNCLFCYCPLYAQGRQCGGQFRFTDSGIKDCTACLRPHRKENYGEITAQLGETLKAMRRDGDLQEL